MKNKEFAAFVAPSMLALLVFTVIPLVVAFSLSLQSFEYWTLNARVSACRITRRSWPMSASGKPLSSP